MNHLNKSKSNLKEMIPHLPATLRHYGNRMVNMAAGLCLLFFLTATTTWGQSISLDWIKSIGDAGGANGSAIAVDAAGNVYVGGSFNSKTDFDPGPDTAFLTPNGFFDIFIAKYTANGQYVWAHKIGGTGSDALKKLIADDAGHIYFTGTFNTTADFNPAGGGTLISNGGTDVFVAKFDTAGNYIWAKQVGGTGGGEFVNGMGIDQSGGVYITGTFTGTIFFGGSGGVLTRAGSAGTDVFIAKYNPDGNYLWAGNVGGGDADQGEGIAVDGSGNVYVTGSFLGTADFDPGNGSATRTAAGANGLFLLKLSQQICTVSTPFTETACDSFTFNGVTYTSGGVHTDTFVYITGADCDSIVTLDLTINSSPVASVTQSGATLTAGGADSYQWLDCDNNSIIDGATSQSYTAVQTGNYAVIITTNDCSDTSECTLVSTSVKELGVGGKVQLYPNPAADLITIQTGQALNSATIRLVNITGHVMAEHAGVSGTLFTLETAPYAAGIYFIEINEQGKSVRLKMVKE